MLKNCHDADGESEREREREREKAAGNEVTCEANINCTVFYSGRYVIYVASEEGVIARRLKYRN